MLSECVFGYERARESVCVCIFAGMFFAVLVNAICMHAHSFVLFLIFRPALTVCLSVIYSCLSFIHIASLNRL